MSRKTRSCGHVVRRTLVLHPGGASGCTCCCCSCSCCSVCGVSAAPALLPPAGFMVATVTHGEKLVRSQRSLGTAERERKEALLRWSRCARPCCVLRARCDVAACPAARFMLLCKTYSITASQRVCPSVSGTPHRLTCHSHSHSSLCEHSKLV